MIGIAHLIGTFAFQARHNPYRPDNRHIFTLPINFWQFRVAATRFCQQISPVCPVWAGIS